MDAMDFRSLKTIPTSVEEVVWPHLEANFLQQCKANATALYQACLDGTTLTSFYVGAGVSISAPSKMPSAATVVKALLETCLRIYPNLEKYAEVVADALRPDGYVLMENTFQNLYEAVRPQEFHAGRIFDIDTTPSRFNVNHTFLAHWLRSRKGTVVTPNLDPLIEHAWYELDSLEGDDLTIVKRPKEFEVWPTHINQPNMLWKLHGSCDDADSWGITLSRVGFPLEHERSSFLSTLVNTHHICFMGYRAADLDLFPPILEAHASKHPTGTQIFWIFYFNEGYQTLDDYLRDEPNIAKLLQSNPSLFRPVVSTAERISAWLQSHVLTVKPTLTAPTQVPTHDFARWLEMDVKAIGESMTQKLIGYTLRILGQRDQAMIVFEDAVAALSKGQEALGIADDKLIRQTAQLLQESAHSLWQSERHHDALDKVKTAHQLLKQLGGDLDCEYGLVSMMLDAKPPLRGVERVRAVLHLLILHLKSRLKRKNAEVSQSAAVVGACCSYLEAKAVDKFLSNTPMYRIHAVRRLLIYWYENAYNAFKKIRFLNSVPDVKSKQAKLWLTLNQDHAVTAMVASANIARTISHAHYMLALQRARQLLESIDDVNAIARLKQEIGSDLALTERAENHK